MPSEPLAAPSATIVIEPPSRIPSLNLGELWRYRELFGFLVWRDIKVKYKQTLLGFAWAIVGPLASTVVFTIIFGRLAKLPADGLQGGLFYLSGLVIWRYFAASLAGASNSLIGNQTLLTKIYLPRIIIPTASLFTAMVDFAIAFPILLGLMFFYFGYVPSITTLLTPLLLLIAMGTALGVGLVFTALNVKYRDVRELVPFVTQLWMYATVIYPFSELPEAWGSWRYLYGLNPMAGVVEGFRWCLAHPYMNETAQSPWPLIGIGAPVTLVMLLIGVYYFRSVERQFADVI